MDGLMTTGAGALGFQSRIGGILGPGVEVLGEVRNPSDREMDVVVRFTVLAGSVLVGENTTRPIWGPILPGQTLSFSVIARISSRIESVSGYRISIEHRDFGVGDAYPGTLLPGG
tara:strand:- start:2726 stop:3070 length:345 start_codon:yes stop_codon:yes gene_type:complete